MEHIIDETSDIPDTDSNIEYDSESDSFFARGRRKETDSDDVPLTNREVIPLLPNANRKQAREAIAMKVIKLNNPGSGYKGDVHIGADEEYIANLYGDGIYTVEFVNNKRKVISKREGIKVAVGMNEDKEKINIGNPSIDALRLAHISHQNERQRTDLMNHEVVKTAKELANNHTNMVMETAKQTTERDRTFYSGQLQNTQSFFASMLEHQRATADQDRARNDQMHQQQMQSQQQMHYNMMQMMEQMHQRSSELNNPMLLLTLFKQGMEMGQGMGDESEPWERVIKTSVEGLSSLRDMQKMSLLTGGGNNVPKAAIPKTIVNPKKPIPANIPSNTPKIQNEIRPEFKELIELKAICDKRGIDFEHVIKEAKEYISKATDADLDLEDNEKDSPENRMD
jgi:hypothetical protein